MSSGIVTAMCTDIVDSSKLKGTMGADTAAGRDHIYKTSVKTPHDERVLTCVHSAGGSRVQSTGDGYLFAFHDAEQAVLCGLAIQHMLQAQAIHTPLGPLRVRIGIHTGIANLIDLEGGAALDKATRVQQHANPGEVCISNETHALVRQLRGVCFEPMATVELKGLGPNLLFRVIRSDDVSPAAGRPSQRITPPLDWRNPYDFATTASGLTFKGRRQEMEELLASLETGTHTAIFGLQRMGKTSLIEQGLKAELESRLSLRNSILMAKVDMQRLGGAQVMYKDFAHAIFEAVVEQLATTGVARDVPDLRALTRSLLAPRDYQRGDRTEFFSVFAKLLTAIASRSRRRIVLFIDEFSEIRKVIERNKKVLNANPTRTLKLLPHDMYIDVPFIHHLSSLLKDPALKGQITFVILVRPFIAEYDEREGLQLLKLMKPITLRYLDEAAAKELITEPLASFVTYEDGVVDYLCQLTAGHPYLLQFMLKLIVDRIKRDGRATVTLTDVKFLQEQMISDGPAYDAQFAVLISDYSVDEVTHPKEAQLGKGLLALVSTLGKNQDGWVTSPQIFEALARYRVPEEKTASLLSQLTRTCILEEDNVDEQLRYRLSIPMVQERFVKQNLFRKYFRDA